MKSQKYEGSCLCGSVEIGVVGPPLTAGICHLESCSNIQRALFLYENSGPKLRSVRKDFAFLRERGERFLVGNRIRGSQNAHDYAAERRDHH
jgi:hypothetical protein